MRVRRIEVPRATRRLQRIADRPNLPAALLGVGEGEDLRNAEGGRRRSHGCLGGAIANMGSKTRANRELHHK